MSFQPKINIDNLDRRFQVTFLKRYEANKAIYAESSSKSKQTISETNANFLFLTNFIIKDLMIYPFVVSFATALAKILLGKYSVILYRQGFVMGAHVKKIIANSYKLYTATPGNKV